VGVSNIFLSSPLPGEMIQFDEHIFQMGGSTTNMLSCQERDIATLVTYSAAISCCEKARKAWEFSTALEGLQMP